VLAIVRVPKPTAYAIWTAIEEQFHDNELHRAVYLEAEYRNLLQGDMDITQYSGRLKQLADALRDVGQPVGETSQALNLLRGLNSKYRHTVPVITSKQPPHTFLSARSYLLLEEHYDRAERNREHAKAATHQALVATGSNRSTPPPTSDGANGSSSNTATRPPPAQGSGTMLRSDNYRGSKKRGRGRGGSTSGNRPPAPGWAPGQNPWTGMVQAWSMPWRVPGAGVLGSRPSAPPHQAYFTGAPSGVPPAPQYFVGPPVGIAPPPPAPAHDVWNQQALLTALTNASVPPSGPQASEWYLDTGASSHMSSNAGNLASLQPVSFSPPITVGNGTTLPVTHHASSAIATNRTPLSLNNVLVSPHLVKNLISVRSLTRDNNVSVEFDPFGFSIKDLPT
jgi:hypothetical protein